MREVQAESQPENGKTKVAVLGGGMASIAAVYEMTQLKENRDKYDITIYQMGWRIGGKGASGRNMQKGGRIEEHGLHLWFGFYDNAFKIMKDAYKEMQRSPNAPLSTFENAFKGHDFVVLMDEYNKEWRTPWAYDFPKNGGIPGEGGQLPSFWTMAWLGLNWVMLNLETHVINHNHPCNGNEEDSDHIHEKGHWWDHIRDIIGNLGQRLHDAETVAASEMLSIVVSVLNKLGNPITGMIDTADNMIEEAIIDLLEKYRAWLWDKYGCHVDNDTARQYLTLSDTAITWVIGLLKDNVRTEGIFSIDKYDLIEWMQKHGANDLSLTAPPVRALYDNIFSYEDGDKNKPNVAAGTSLLWAMRMVMTYKGHIMYKMQAGMGDTVFTPFYDVLKQRGVNFKFFHCVQNLGLNDGKDEIESIQVMPQVDLTVNDYDPFVLVDGLPSWPDQPNWDQLVDGDALKAKGVNFEHPWTVPERKSITLQRGQDFDIVILGIPIAANKHITQEMVNNADNPSWKTMHDNVKTVQTQAYQVWFNKTLEELGFASDKPPVLGTYVELIDTYADMSHLIPVENSPASDDVQNIAYWCGAMPDTKTQNDADELAKADGLRNFTEDMPRVWSNLEDENGDIHWDWLVDADNAQGKARFDAQFFRANWTGTERYTLSLAGTTKYRIKTDATGYNNLYIVGDWIDNSFNSGCIEACTMSGMQASRAICGYPKTISGEDEEGWLGRG